MNDNVLIEWMRGGLTGISVIFYCLLEIEGKATEQGAEAAREIERPAVAAGPSKSPE